MKNQFKPSGKLTVTALLASRLRCQPLPHTQTTSNASLADTLMADDLLPSAYRTRGRPQQADDRHSVPVNGCNVLPFITAW